VVDRVDSAQQQGHSVALSDDGSTVAIGAYLNDGINGTNSGHVRVYRFDGSGWIQLGDDIDAEAASDQFVTNCAVDRCVALTCISAIV
jgi:hypothetical protein